MFLPFSDVPRVTRPEVFLIGWTKVWDLTMCAILHAATRSVAQTRTVPASFVPGVTT